METLYDFFDNIIDALNIKCKDDIIEKQLDINSNEIITQMSEVLMQQMNISKDIVSSTSGEFFLL